VADTYGHFTPDGSIFLLDFDALDGILLGTADPTTADIAADFPHV